MFLLECDIHPRLCVGIIDLHPIDSSAGLLNANALRAAVRSLDGARAAKVFANGLQIGASARVRARYGRLI